MRNKQKFEEEVAVEETTSDPKATIVAALTEMGLSAEQAEAVYQTAADLVAAEPAVEEKVEASRERRTRHARREMSRRPGSRSRGRREMSRRPNRTRLSREDRAAASLRREVRMLKKQMEQLGGVPAEGPQKRNPIEPGAPIQPTIPTDGTVKERAFAIMNQFDLK